MKTAIIIPARYASTRLPGKPLAMIAGQTMLSRVVAIAREAAAQLDDVQVVVATDDARIVTHCDELSVTAVMTPVECKTGTDRVQAALAFLPNDVEFVVNLQGDAPLTPPDFVSALIASYQAAPVDVVTTVTQLSWAQLDTLRENKKTTPGSGTCAVFDPATGKAFWFSKQIIPTIRKEVELRAAFDLSPVFRHIGLYSYARCALRKFISLPEGAYEKLEALEQLRFLENGMTVRCIQVDYAGRPAMSGIDAPEDIKRAEALLASFK